MTSLMFKRVFNLNGTRYLYKVEKTAPDEVQKTFGKITKADESSSLHFLPREGITHKIGFNSSTGQVDTFEIMDRRLNDYGTFDVFQTESVSKSKGKFPYWVTIKGNHIETAYVKTEDVNKIKTPQITTSVFERDYENKPIGYDKLYTSPNGDVLEYSYFPNLFDPRLENKKAEKDILDEDKILVKADRLIKRLKNMQNSPKA